MNHFLRFLIGRGAFSLVESVLSVAIGWHLYQITKDPFALALVGLFQIIPVYGLFLISGWVIDHVSRKKILVCGSIIQTLNLFVIALIMNADTFSKWHLFLLLSVSGAVKAFMSPALQAVMVNIVPKEQLNRAIALNGTVWNLATTIGPFLAGILIAIIAKDVYWLLVFCSVLTSVSFLMLPEIKVKAASSASRSVHGLLEGIQFLKQNPTVFGCLFIDLMIVLLGSTVALLPVYAADILKVGAEGLGLLRAMPAVGAVLIGLYVSKYKQEFKRTGATLFYALTVFALSIVIFAISDNIWLSAMALFLYGASDMFSVVIRGAVVQHATPDHLRGRVSSVNSIFIASSNQLGDFRAGSVASIAGTANAALMGGISAVLVVVGSAWYFKELRALKSADLAEN